MRDPYEFINFFKLHVFHEVEDVYTDFLEDIKMLRENHIMIKGHEKSQGRNFINLGKKFRKSIENLSAIHDAFQSYPDQIRSETIDNLVETLIYERIGTYIRKQLTSMYMEEEKEMVSKCVALNSLFDQNLNKFNDALKSQLFANMKPDKSLRILKLLITKSQLPYEMMFILSKTMQMAAQELAVYHEKPAN